MKDLNGDFAAAAEIVSKGIPPEKYLSLVDAYRLRMLVLANLPSEGPKIISAAQELSWYNYPKTAEDEYAADYCRYIAAGVSGDVPGRKALERKLAESSVKKRVYRNALKVT